MKTRNFMRINCDYTFQNYLGSDNKKDARKAMSSAMALPGQIYNPIFIYGSVGVGKTHLLQALAQEYKTDLKIYYISVEQFVNDIVQAIQNYRNRLLSSPIGRLKRFLTQRIKHIEYFKKA